GLMVRNGQHSGQWLLVLVALTEAVPHLEVLSERLQAQCPWLTSLVLNINPERTNRVLGFEDKVLFGPGYIEERLGHLDFNLSPQSFFQVNPSQTEQLYGLVQDFAGLDGSQVVFDLYSGVGTIALFLAAKAAKVVGIESVAQAVADARQNAERNQITNVEFHQGQAEVLMPALYEQGQRADVVVLDPPRKGCDKALLDTLLAMAPQAVVYVSCDPANLGRDLAVLLAGGYRLDKVQPLDMFPHSLHVETLVLLKRN
ncbi:23S rRNA (uracil(1939)-C(5))-methyltransferase RlmD, partial [Gallaecimonas xiamenensis]